MTNLCMATMFVVQLVLAAVNGNCAVRTSGGSVYIEPIYPPGGDDTFIVYVNDVYRLAIPKDNIHEWFYVGVTQAGDKIVAYNSNNRRQCYS